MTFERALAREAKRLRILLTPEESGAFMLLHDMLTRWNARLNLTGLHRAEDIARVLFAESLLPERMNASFRGALLDVGSGAGFPALPLAVRHPALRVTMVESNARKAVFLREAAAALGLKSVEVVDRRLEEAVMKGALKPPYDFFTMRGVGDASKIFPLLASLAAKPHAAFVFAKEEHRDAAKKMERARVTAEKKISETTWLLKIRFSQREAAPSEG